MSLQEIAVSGKSEIIRDLNDRFRETFTGGVVTITPGVAALPDHIKRMVLHRVRTFDQFCEANDPHGEHDFGSFIVEGTRYAFKIDYYDREMDRSSEDPANPAKTTRCLCVMRMDEY